VNDITNKIRREFDVKRQQELAADLQRMLAKASYHIPYGPFAALSVGVYWPVIGNLGVYRGAPAGSAAAETAIHWWIDDTKKPLAQS
jgi:hypothetical protein